MKTKEFLIIILLILAGIEGGYCQTVISKETKEDFSTFLTKFKSSEEFQLQRVIFPLKYTQFQDFDMDDLDTTIVKADYICQDLEFKEDYFYKIIDGDSMEEKLYEITGKECGIYVLYHFTLKDNKWHLVKLEDLSN